MSVANSAPPIKIPPVKKMPPQKPKNDMSWFTVVTLSGFIAGILLFTMGWYLSLPDAQRSAVFHHISKAGEIFPGMVGLTQSKTMLVMGVDMPPRGASDAYQAVRTDTMMLVKMDTGNHKVNVISIPRDSRVYIAGGHGVDKINAAYPIGGIDTVLATVQQTLGVNVDNYMIINIRGVRDVVEALGGIDIYIEKPMHYRDRTAGLTINLEPGLHHLDGKQAEGYIRFRHDAYGDIGRIRRQQQFIAAMSAKLKDPMILLKVKPLIEASGSFMKTNMSPTDLIQAVLFAKDLQKSDYQVATLPGHAAPIHGISYWVIDAQETEAVLNRMISGIQPDESAVTEIPSVGILYTPSHTQDLAEVRQTLEAKGYAVRCQSRIRQSASRLVAHRTSLPQQQGETLRKLVPALADAQLIFSPHGTTFETNSCGSTDYTVILGDDTRSATTP